MVTPVERVVLPVASAVVGLATVTGGDVGSTARLDAMASVPREGTSSVSAGGWVVSGLVRTTGVGDKTVPGDECRSLVGREDEEDAGTPVGLGDAPISVVPLAKLAVFAVRGPGAVSEVGGTELGLEVTDGPSAAVMEVGAGDGAAVGVALWPPPSAGLEITPSPAGPLDVGAGGWPGAGVRKAMSLEPVPTEGEGGLLGTRGDTEESSPSPGGRERNINNGQTLRTTWGFGEC